MAILFNIIDLLSDFLPNNNKKTEEEKKSKREHKRNETET